MEDPCIPTGRSPKGWQHTLPKKIRVHDLRHTTVDLLYAAGVDEDDITQIVGHSTRAMSRSYRSKRDIERLRASMVKFSRSLER